MYYAVGKNSKFYKSTDGESWSVSTLPVAGDYKGVSFIDSNNGWICGNNGVLTPIILKTTNGGNTWVQQTPPDLGVDIEYKLNDILFVNSMVGFCASYMIHPNPSKYSPILKTIDGGVTWGYVENTLFTFGYALNYRRLIKLTNNLILMIADSPEHSTNCSLIYNILLQSQIDISNNYNDGVIDGSGINENNYQISSYLGTIYLTNDGGIADNQLVNIDLTTSANALYFTSDRVGHVGTDNGKMFRLGGDLTPKEQTYAGTQVNSISMVNATEGIAVGNGGQIYKYKLN